MVVVVLRRYAQTRSPRLHRPSLLGDGLPERLRSTSFALLGVTAAAGLGTVALALQQGVPLVDSGPVPGLPSERSPSPDSAAGGDGGATPRLASSAGADPVEAPSPSSLRTAGEPAAVAPPPSPAPAPALVGRSESADGGAEGGERNRPSEHPPERAAPKAEAPAAPPAPEPVATPSEAPALPPEPDAAPPDHPGNGNAYGKGNGKGPGGAGPPGQSGGGPPGQVGK